MIRVTTTAAATGSLTIQDPFPTDGKLVIYTVAGGTTVTDMTVDQYTRIKPQLDQYVTSGQLASVAVSDLAEERSDEWLELKERTAKVATISTTGGAAPNLVTLGVRKGDVFNVYDAAPVPTTVSYTITAVHGPQIFEATSTVTAFDLSGAGDAYYVTRGGVEIATSRRTVGVGAVTHVIATVSQTPYQRTGFGKIFVKAADSKPYFLMDNGTELSLGMTGSDPLIFKGAITTNADFPTAAAVQTGWLYRILADVTDNDATKTNTGQSFMAGSEIAWNGTNWSPLGTEMSSVFATTTPVALAQGDVLVNVDTVTIAGPAVVNLPAASATRVGKYYYIVDVSGGASVVNNVAITPNGADTIDGVVAALLITTPYTGYFVQCVQTGAATYGWSTGVDAAVVARLGVIGSGQQCFESYQHAAATETLRVMRALVDGTITGVTAETAVIAGAGETMTFSVLINAVEATDPATPLVVDTAAGIDNPIAWTPNPAPGTQDFVAGDLITVVRTYVAGAPTPMVDTACTIQVVYA